MKIEQDIERWERELREAGWRPYRYRGRERKTMWVSPGGAIFRGPYGAWRVMRSCIEWPESEAGKRISEASHL